MKNEANNNVRAALPSSSNQKNLVLQGRGSEFDLSGVLQMIEAQGFSGAFTLGRYRLDFYAGQVVGASEDAIETVAGITNSIGVFTFHKNSAAPIGTLRLSLTALLLEAARRNDEANSAKKD